MVILLGVIFFALLALIILKGGKRHEDPAQMVETLTVLPAKIRIRTEPNARAAVVSTANSGDNVLVLDDRGTWVRVRTSDGLEGWAERTYLERTNERTRRLARFAAIRHLPALRGIVTHRTPLYAGPGIFYPLVGELSEDAKVTVFTRDHDFYAIDYQGQVAYADIDGIDVSSSGTRQLDVQTTSAAPTDTTTTSEPETEAATETEPPPAPEQPEQPEPADQVYAAVPPGGTQPEEVDRVIPRYPALARRAGVQGAVVIRGIVRRDGTIDNVEIIRDLPHGLGESARQAVSRWRFRPATYRGEPID
ncbi:MAG TPA: TonB family protein, partial [Thermoanaerobaculia bacterium]|nr:TonB family protein [Thermoanaerobaculia bacterium]